MTPRPQTFLQPSQGAGQSFSKAAWWQVTHSAGTLASGHWEPVNRILPATLLRMWMANKHNKPAAWPEEEHARMHRSNEC
jgi:hypothetical protein